MLKRRFFWLVCWGIAFGYIEASVVVYLRELYYPAGFSFPVVLIDTHIAVVELVRETTTLLFMWAVAELSYRSFQCRLAVFMFLFGIWDIFYYIFLKVILNWPASLAEWDILFLVPLPWVGPVWAPVAVSLGMIAAGTLILIQNEHGRPMRLTPGFMLFEVAAGLIIIVSFLIPGQAVIRQTVPEHFPWYLFAAGLGAGLGVFGLKAIRDRGKKGSKFQEIRNKSAVPMSLSTYLLSLIALYLPQFPLLSFHVPFAPLATSIQAAG